MANIEEDTNDFRITQSGYQRFFNDVDDLTNCDNAIITVRRKEQITTHFGPLKTTNKIKVSLSQEQIVNRLNGMKSGIRRSQSINIEKTAEFPARDRSLPSINRHSLRPSLIPVKIKETQKICAPTSTSANEAEIPRNRNLIRRNFSISNDRRDFTSKQDHRLNSLPTTMTQSVDIAFYPKRDSNAQNNKLADKFKCGICLNMLSDPRVLNCLHTFCLECLYGIENTNHSRASSNKVSMSTSCESSVIDMSGTNQLEMANDSKGISNRRMSKVCIASIATNPIKKIFSPTPKKRADERRVSYFSFLLN